MRDKTAAAVASDGRAGAGVAMRVLDVVTGRSGRVRARSGWPVELAGTRLVEERDVRGFDTGMFIDAAYRQATINLAVGGVGGGRGLTVAEDTWRRWEDAVARVERMVCTCTIDEAGAGAAGPRIATTFRAVGKAERRDLDRLATDMSLRSPALYDHAEAMGLAARPMSAADVGSVVCRGLTGSSGSFDDLGRVRWESSTDQVVVSSPVLEPVGAGNGAVDGGVGPARRRCVALTADTSDPSVAGVIDQIMADWENLDEVCGAALVRRTRFFRPYVVPEGTGENRATGHGRRWAVLTIVGTPAVDAVLRQVVDAVPEVGLKVRRRRGVQRVSVLSGVGVGVCGWQHTTGADRIGRI
ncbi:hypothetical protein [Corynebacterium bovis]|uniref:hypothetical protein n=3 Tax=Corynebacterium bovis TaxID=36808 RepID=UPI000F64DF00|nr:hypothetical protein [Corynebacterium bovis]